MNEIIFYVKGMMCEGCENRVQNIVKKIDGVNDVKADYKTGKVTVFVKNIIDKNSISEAIEDIGYEVVKE